jgi:hypothetical protein
MSSSRHRRFDGAGVAAVLALLACALLAGASLAGCGGGSSGTSTQARTPTSGSGAGSTNTATASSTGASKTASTARPAPAPAKASKVPTPKPAAPDSTVQAPAPVGGRLLRRFTGSGSTRLGTIVASSSQVLVWKTQHPAIQIFTANGFLLVSSRTSSGSVVLRHGKYTGVRVASRAGWTIELRARSH